MNKTYIIFAFLIIAIVAGAIWLGGKATVPSYSQKDPNRPIVAISERSFDLGKMKVSDTKSYDFTITNKGKSDLTLSQISTSCDCTFAKVIKADGTESPTLAMHAKNSWQTSLKSNEAATLRVIYKPSIMPVEGPVERFVTISTNDPENPKIEVKVSAEVSK